MYRASHLQSVVDSLPQLHCHLQRACRVAPTASVGRDGQHASSAGARSGRACLRAAGTGSGRVYLGATVLLPPQGRARALYVVGLETEGLGIVASVLFKVVRQPVEVGCLSCAGPVDFVQFHFLSLCRPVLYFFPTAGCVDHPYGFDEKLCELALQPVLPVQWSQWERVVPRACLSGPKNFHPGSHDLRPARHCHCGEEQSDCYFPSPPPPQRWLFVLNISLPTQRCLFALDIFYHKYCVSFLID